MNRFITIARIVKVRGIRGEVAAEILTEFPSRFASVSQVRIHCQENQYWEELEEYRFHRNRILLKFTGRDRPEAVADFVGCEVQVPERERVALPEDFFYDSDLIGCRVLEHGVTLGQVKDLFRTGAEGANLIVVDHQGKEFMVPLVREFIRSVDVERKEIRVSLPPGLRDL